MRWYINEVITSNDPLLYLDHLDSLFYSFLPESIVDVFVWGTSAQIRDRMYLAVIKKNCLPEEQIVRWLEEKSKLMEVALNGYRAERQTIWEPLAQSYLRDIDQTNYLHIAYDFFGHFSNDIATIMRTILFYEDIFSGKRNPVEIVLDGIIEMQLLK